MDIRTLSFLCVAQLVLNIAFAIPLDKELYRVKRKGLDDEEDFTLTKRVRRAQSNTGEQERELRKKRRFFSDEEDQTEKSLNELYENKMAERSSRSSREDKDVTAGGGMRFKTTNKMDSSGSGSGFDDMASGSGLWMPAATKDHRDDVSFPKTAEKRSARVNSLEKLVSALKAITIPDDVTGFAKSDDSSASGSGILSDTVAMARRAKLTRALADVAPLTSGSGEDEITEKRSVVIHFGSGEEDELVSSGTTLVRREVAGETLADELVEAAKEISPSVSEMEDEQVGRKKRDFLDDFLEASVERERRTPLLTDVDADGDSLVVRFYRDQDMQENEAASAASLPSENKHEDEITGDSYSDFFNAPDSGVPRVISKKEISGYHEPIIEMPAVYGPSSEDDEMDSSDGGPDGEGDVPIEVHERHIEDDGYIGCYVDKTPDRDLPHSVSVAELTPDACRVACKDAGHAYAGVQYGYLCRCGDNYGKYSKVAEAECNSACKGDGSQKCGGFYRSSIYATAGATEPKQGNFFHIESIEPIEQGAPYAGYSAMTSGYASGSADPYSGAQQDSSSFTVSQSPLNMAYDPFEPGTHSSYITTMTPSISTAEVHSIPQEITPETSEVPNVSFPNEARASVEQPITAGLTEARSEVQKPGHFEPKGTHGSPWIYLHPQQDIVSRTKVDEVPSQEFKAEGGKRVFTGSVKLKQSWFDELRNKNSAKFKILAGNVEEALRKIFSKDPAFTKAKVLEFREGLVKHNPNTIRKVIAPFALTFANGATNVQEKLKKMVEGSGRLFDMPVYKDSLKVAEYYQNKGLPNQGIENSTSQVETKSMESKGELQPKRVPYTLQLFLMKDLFGKTNSGEGTG